MILKMNQLTIFTIATGEYLSYWFKLIESSTKFLDKQLSVQWILLTDKKEEVLSNKDLASDLNLLIKPIEIRDGNAILSTEPGFGIQWDWEAVKRFSS